MFQHGLGGDAAQPQALVPVRPCERRLTLECRGHGRSELGPRRQLRFSQFADDLRVALRESGIKRAVLGGISMGAAVACAVAAEPEDLRIEGLVLVRPAWATGPMTEPARTLYAHLAAVLEQHKDPAEARAAFAGLPTVKEVARTAPAAHASLLGHFDERPRDFLELCRRLPGDTPVNQRDLVQLRVPALVVCTERDPVHPTRVAEQLADALPQARLVRVPSKSEDPGKHQARANHAVEAFLRQVRSGTWSSP